MIAEFYLPVAYRVLCYFILLTGSGFYGFGTTNILDTCQYVAYTTGKLF